MRNDGPLFGLRFDSDVELNPSPEELRRFLATTVKTDSQATEGNDLARYHELLEELQAFARGSGTAVQDVRERVFCAVLGHTQFANTGLELAVGQYKYHLATLRSLDLRKNAAFVRSAEAELDRLRPRKKENATRRERLIRMLDERKRELEVQQQLARTVPDELVRIAKYIRDNLVGIMGLCRPPASVLDDPGVVQGAENMMVDGIKERVKEQLKDALHLGTVSRQDLEIARKEVEALAGEASSLARNDISAVIDLLRAVQDHVQKHVSAIDALLPALGNSGKGSSPAGMEPFIRLEGILVSLVSGHRFVLGAGPSHGGTAYGLALAETRKDLFGHIVSLLGHDRRTRHDRRANADRRSGREPHVQFMEMRSGVDRRSGRNRRLELSGR